MRLSCGNDSFPLLPHDVSVELVAQLGFEGYDLSLAGDRSQITPAEVLADPDGWVALLEERVRGRGLEFSDVFYVPGSAFETKSPNHPDSAERARGRDEFRAILEFAVRLGAPGMTMLPGLDWPGETHETSLTRAIGELRERVDEAGERGVRLSVEPHLGSVCRTPSDIALLCEGSGLALTLDYTHYVCQGFEEAELDPLLRYVRHFHARGGDATRMQAPLRDNTLEWERMLAALGATGFTGFVAVEYCWVEWEGLNKVDVLTETVLMRDRLRAALSGGAG